VAQTALAAIGLLTPAPRSAATTVIGQIRAFNGSPLPRSFVRNGSPNGREVGVGREAAAASARANVFGSGVDVGVVVDAAGEQQEVLGE
jgi:hypothetical protein